MEPVYASFIIWRLRKQTISCRKVREKAGIVLVKLPEDFDPTLIYDKWGNLVDPPADDEDDSYETVDNEACRTRRPGSMFMLDNVQKILKDGGVLHLFSS